MPTFLKIQQNIAVAVLCMVFLLSGAASLSFQVVWQRVLTQEIGVDYYSVVTIVSIFIIGLGLGSLLGGKIRLHEA